MDGWKAEAGRLAAELKEINARIARVEGATQRASLVAVVSAEACRGCGLCADVCPEGAITVDTIAVIDTARCTGCGRCVAECPRDALALAGQ